MNEEHLHTAGDDEAAHAVEGPAAPLLRREPIVVAMLGTSVPLGAGLALALRRGDRESAAVFAAALGLIGGLGSAARRAVTPVALPRRGEDAPLIDAPPEMLEQPAAAAALDEQSTPEPAPG
jgi:hypothetical protein